LSRPANGGGRCPFASRRGFIAAAGGLLVGAAAKPAKAGPAMAVPPEVASPGSPNGPPGIEPFYGRNQGGILTPPQRHSYFASFDLMAKRRDDVVALLRAWTTASARMTQGQPAQPIGDDLTVPGGDSGDVLGLPASRLTITFGFGAGLFIKDGKDRYGLAAQRPAALVDLPAFNGDQLVDAHTGGDLSVQACADDPQVAFHAVRQLARLAYDHAQLRWTQAGFQAGFASGETPRNLMGFKDGTRNPTATPSPGLKPVDQVVWVGDDGPAWMRGGSYVVTRRIRIALEHWDRTQVDFQEEVVGRHKYSGAPLGKHNEFDAPDLDAVDGDGNPVIAETAHVRLAAAEMNDGAEILRRAYSYNDGSSFTAERWPPWRQGIEYDAGLFFVAYQRDPRSGFIRIFENMAKMDAMNQYTTHVGSGLFACPGGIAEGSYVGQGLFEA
jgi:deferrochelatase/peroxidase EfeB